MCNSQKNRLEPLTIVIVYLLTTRLSIDFNTLKTKKVNTLIAQSIDL